MIPYFRRSTRKIPHPLTDFPVFEPYVLSLSAVCRCAEGELRLYLTKLGVDYS